jgi:low temperature requirement protein LtrA
MTGMAFTRPRAGDVAAGSANAERSRQKGGNAMGRSPHRSPPPTGNTHRVTPFEIFFDLVFVFAFTRIMTFMARDPTPLALLQGLILLMLTWWAWSAYTWLGNQTRADKGLAMAGGTVAMAAVFVVGLLIPEAWGDIPGGFNGPLILALAYILVRVLYMSTYLYAAAGDRILRHQLTTGNISTVIALIPFIVGAVVGGRAQLWLWAVTLVIDFGGGAIVSRYGGFRVRSPGYFAERHGLVVIIALGESLAAVAAGVGGVPVTAAILGAALLGFAVTVCLWLLYFRAAAPSAERRLMQLQGKERAWLARDVGTLLHFPLIAGIIYIALGIEQVLVHVSRPDTGRALGWVPLTALYGGAAVYLAGRTAIMRRSSARISWVRPAAVAIPLVLVPVAHALSAFAALALITVVLAGLVAAEYARGSRPADEDEARDDETRVA